MNAPSAYLISPVRPPSQDWEGQRCLEHALEAAGVRVQAESTLSFVVEGDLALIQHVLSLHPEWEATRLTVAAIKDWEIRHKASQS